MCAVPGFFVFSLDQQPVLALAVAAHADEIPSAFQTLAMKCERKMPFLQSGVRIFGGLPGSLIPQHDRAAAVLALGDGPFEGAIGKRMILRPHRQPFIGGTQAGTFRDRPT